MPRKKPIRNAATAVDKAAKEVAETADAYERGVRIVIPEGTNIIDILLDRSRERHVDVIPKPKAKK